MRQFLFSVAFATVALTGTAKADIGIEACDQFLNQYEACLNEHVPAESRAMLQQSIEAWRSSWKQVAEATGNREQLAATCEQTRAAAAPSLQAYGCQL